MGDLVGAAEESPVPSSSNPCPTSVGLERWARAEEATQKIICRVQPSAVSERRRREVVDYVQRLIRGRLGCEIFPFGSVPLKTYLPDGDIDLTAFSVASFEDALMTDVVSVLEAEDKNTAAEFMVKDVQLIRAEVKLVKCIVQSIVVDISFNQLGGLCTLCFLEQVDRLIGKDHLFKRSIILIKAWCYYESRILGAHHGLISTYALETLVLYIFHLFHSSLNGPLAVLYRFLDYFSKFDWENYCISLTGPVRVSSLPKIVAEKPENGGSDLLLSDDFLRYCADMFSVPSRGVDICSRAFPQKHLNIIDPLKENNNLGRSVSKGNFYRIRSAFTYGARKLGQILLQPEDSIVSEIPNFFSNTLDRHGSGQRPDVQDPVPMSSHNGFVPEFSFSDLEEKENSDSKPVNTIGINGAHDLDLDGSSHNGGTNGQINGHPKGSKKVFNSTSSSETNGFVNETAVMDRFSGDAEDLATSRIQGLTISDDTFKTSHPRSEESTSQRGIAFHAPHLYFSHSISGNGKPGHGEEYSGSNLDQVSLHGEEIDKYAGRDMYASGSKDVGTASNPVSCSSMGFDPCYQEKTSTSDYGSSEYLNSMSELGGDYESHLSSLQYGRWCSEQSRVPSLHHEFQSKSSRDGIQNSFHSKRNGFFNMNPNGVVPRPAFYHMNSLLIPRPMEEMPMPRGTGTYFPNVNPSPHHMPLTGRRRKQAPVWSPRNNGQALTPTEANLLDRRGREPPQSPFPNQDKGKLGFSDFHESGSPGGELCPNPVGLLHQSEGVLEFGSAGHIPLEVLLPSLAHTSNQSLLTLGMQKPKAVPDVNQDRFMVKSSYHLKDEDDFPPLST